MKIVADSSVLLTREQGLERGIEVLPLSVSIEGQTWAEYEDISAEDFLERVRGGALPTSSSPAPAAILSAYDTEEEVLHLSMADGLSGAFEVAGGLAKQARHPERVHLLNTETLCMPHRVLALAAVELAKIHHRVGDVVEGLRPMIASASSFLIPEDFDYLRRGGRLTPLAARFVHLLKAVPVLTQTKDGTRLERLSIARSFGKAVAAVVREMERRGVHDSFLIGVSHAGNLSQAQEALRIIGEAFPRCRTAVFNLSPAFITQGGPGCVAIQAIDLKSFPSLSVE